MWKCTPHPWIIHTLLAAPTLLLCFCINCWHTSPCHTICLWGNPSEDTYLQAFPEYGEIHTSNYSNPVLVHMVCATGMCTYVWQLVCNSQNMYPCFVSTTLGLHMDSEPSPPSRPSLSHACFLCRVSLPVFKV